ncbi:MAG: hypothetical protein K2I32_06965 [Alistipes sp.]|nr:hypothetical protein [Alistipes sp.]
MKSEKAQHYLGLHVDQYGFVHINDAIQAIEIAEKDVLTRGYHELTKWNDPQDILPEPGKHVLVKRLMGLYDIDTFDPASNHFLLESSLPMKVIGWRYIHE